MVSFNHNYFKIGDYVHDNNYFEIGNYVYDNKRNFYLFKIVDRHFHEIAFYLEEFKKILYDYDNNIIKHNYKDFDHKNDKKK